MNVLLVGEKERVDILWERLQNIAEIVVDKSDGDEDEDFEEYDVIFDLNFDDEGEHFDRYAAMRDKIVIVSAVKQSLAEAVYNLDGKLRCKLFGMNAIGAFLNDPILEISAYRKFEIDDFKILMGKLSLDFRMVEDRVGLIKMRIIAMLINEACYTFQEGTATIEDIDLSMKLGTNYPFGPFEWCDKIGITAVFECLFALYEDTKDERYKICPLLKNKYLRDETFYKKKKEIIVPKNELDF